MKKNNRMAKIWTATLLCMAVLLLFSGVFIPTGVALADWQDDYDSYLAALPSTDNKDWYFGEDYLDTEGAKAILDGFFADQNFDKQSLIDDPIIIAVIDSGIGCAYTVEGTSVIPLDPLSVYQEGAVYKLHPIFDDVLLKDDNGDYVYKNVADTITIKKKNALGNYVNTGQVIEGVTDSGDIALDLVDNSSNDHGTHCTGIVAMLIHMLGLEDYVKILPIKANTILNYNGSEYLAGYSNATATPYLTEAVQFAYDNGADIVSMSLTADSADAFDFSEFVDDMVLVAAAGNTGKNEKGYPAAHDGVVGVMNYDKGTSTGTSGGTGTLSSSSTYGSWFDVAAPGTNVISALNSGGFKKMSGTSMATPMVAMASALAEIRYRGYNGYGTTIELTPAVVEKMMSHGITKKTTNALISKQVPMLSLTHVLSYNYYGDIDFINKIMSAPEGVDIVADAKAEYTLGGGEKITLTGKSTPANTLTTDRLYWWYEYGGEIHEIGYGWTVEFDVPKVVGNYTVRCAVVDSTNTQYALANAPLTFSVVYATPADVTPSVSTDGSESPTSFVVGDTYTFTLPTENFNPDVSYDVVWYVNGEVVCEGDYFNFTPETSGEYVVTVSVNGVVLEDGFVVSVSEQGGEDGLSKTAIVIIVTVATAGFAGILYFVYKAVKGHLSQNA